MTRVLLLLAEWLADACKSHALRTGDVRSGLIGMALYTALEATCCPGHTEMLMLKLDKAWGESVTEWPEEIGR